MTQKRRRTLNEKIYSIAEGFSPPFAIQFVLKGKGQLDLELLEKAIQQLSDLIPALRMRLRGNRWEHSGPEARLFFHKKNLPEDWDDPFFRNPLSAGEGSASTFHLFRNEDDCLVFRALHSVMDAKGALQVLYHLFDLMNGQDIAPDASFPSDIAVRKAIARNRKRHREGYDFKWAALSLPRTHPTAYRTAVVFLEEKLEKSLARLACWYTRRLNRNCRFLIPVDIRRHKAVKASTANLSLPIYLHVSPHETETQVQARLLKALYEQEELRPEALESFGVLAPGAMLRAIFRLGISQAIKKDLFPMSGILSDIGMVNPERLSTKGFQADRLIPLPVYVPLAPFCVNIISQEDKTTLGITLPYDCPAEMIEELRAALAPTSSGEKISFEKEEIPQEAEDIRELWADILEIEIEEVSLKTSFSSLGGDSLGFLTMLTEASEIYLGKNSTAFLNRAMDSAGEINILQLIELIRSHSTQTNNNSS